MNAAIQGTDLPRAPDRWANVAAWALVVLAVVTACNKVWNYDIHWHLKSGQWMLEHRQVLDKDPFSCDDPEAPNTPRWINMHWLFQVLMATVHRLGDFDGLVLLKMALFGANMAVLVFWLRTRIPPTWLMITGLWLIFSLEQRIRERPEIITFLFLTITLLLTESVRRGASARRLWWLVLVNILWVNMHGLFIVGVVSLWAGVSGAWLDRLLKRQPANPLTRAKALVPCVAATLACLVSPWPLEAVLHPLLLQARVSGAIEMYTYGVQEFRPTYQLSPFGNWVVMLGMTTALAMLVVMVLMLWLELFKLPAPRLPIGHILWFAMFLYQGAMAVRNIALGILPAAILLALHGGELMRAVGAVRPSWRRIGKPTAWAMLALLAGTAVSYATEAAYRWSNRPALHFGLGLAQGIHPIDMAKWLGRINVDGDVLPLDFGEGGTFIYYSYPRRKVYMDGRLEVQSIRRFERLQEIRAAMHSPKQAGDPVEMPLPASVRFIVARYTEATFLDTLGKCPRFKLVYLDRSGACFARIPQPGEKVSWPAEQPLPASNLTDYDRPYRPGQGSRRTSGLLTDEPVERHWYRQNVEPMHWRMGALLYTLGLDSLAARYLIVADRLGLQEPVMRKGMLAQALQRLAEHQPVEPDSDLPTDPLLSMALATYEQMDLTNLGDDQTRTFALVRVRALIAGRQIDAADQAMGEYLARLPMSVRYGPSAEEVEIRDSIKGAYQAALKRRENVGIGDLTPVEQAHVLLGKDMGLIDHALDILRSQAQPSARSRRFLGDLYLRKGRATLARAEYLAASGRDVPPDMQMRLGLCDWADGNLASALERLTASAEKAGPAPTFYLALLLEQLGEYPRALDVLTRHVPTPQEQDTSVEKLLTVLRLRLKLRGYDIPPAGIQPAGGAGEGPAVTFKETP